MRFITEALQRLRATAISKFLEKSAPLTHLPSFRRPAAKRGPKKSTGVTTGFTSAKQNTLKQRSWLLRPASETHKFRARRVLHARAGLVEHAGGSALAGITPSRSSNPDLHPSQALFCSTRGNTTGKAGKGWPGTRPSPSSCQELSLSIAGKAAPLPLRHPRDRWHSWSIVSFKAFQSTLLLHQRCFSEVLPHSHFRSRGQFHWRRVLFFYKRHPQHLQVILASGTSPKFGILSQVSAGLCWLAGDPPWEYFL